MSLFNKPKRNIRRRLDDQEDNFNEETPNNEVHQNTNSNNLSNKSSKKKDNKQPKQTLLSFGEELEEADDGEVFRVKKTSRSKKLMKQLDQERRRKKEDKHQQPSLQSLDTPCLAHDKDMEIKTDDLVLKIKNTAPTILSGRDALIAGKNDYSSEDEIVDTGHKFTAISMRIQSGVIPDAATIHEARKKRQKMREQGADFIPVSEEQQNQSDKKNRLIREEDDDHSDENSQDRIDMTVNTDARDRERRRQVFLDSQESPDEDQDQEFEHEEWEVQQIRKAVTGAQIAAVIPQSGPMMPLPPPPPTIQPPDLDKMAPMAPEEVLNKMRNRLINLRETLDHHQSNYGLMEQELKESGAELERGESKIDDMAEKFRFYQELRGYVNDLVECLDQKLPLVEKMEERYLDLYGERAAELSERRRQDTRDQAEEVTMIARGVPLNSKKTPEETARLRRATEREGRRSRRRRAREIDSLRSTRLHMDGMSSDDEVTEHQKLLFNQAKEEIVKDCAELFNDVVDDFCTIKGVLSRMEDWKYFDPESYNEAYASLCIPKMISPIIRLQLITWNPLTEPVDIDRTSWYNYLITYALRITESEENLKQDPDVKLIPLTVEKVVVPKLQTIVEKIYDPMSNSQTLRLINLMNRLVGDYPTLNDSSKQLEALFNAIFEKIQAAVDHDVFIPIFPGLEPKHSFFQRQFSMAIKLLRNIISWQGLLGDTKLKNIALSSLLNRYVLSGLRILHPTDAIKKADMIAKILPSAWSNGSNVEHFKMFALLIKQLADQLDQADPAHNEAWETSKALINKAFIKKNL